MIKPLQQQVQAWAVAPLDTARSRPVAELQAALTNLGAVVQSYASVAAALEGQCAQATADDEILLFGSFFCVGEALQWLDRQATEDGANGIAG
ncbi:bifunctional folylpolyglutamate synthase/ dihydrofolate synthase [compost metagenome]